MKIVSLLCTCILAVALGGAASLAYADTDHKDQWPTDQTSPSEPDNSNASQQPIPSECPPGYWWQFWGWFCEEDSTSTPSSIESGHTDYSQSPSQGSTNSMTPTVSPSQTKISSTSPSYWTTSPATPITPTLKYGPTLPGQNNPVQTNRTTVGQQTTNGLRAPAHMADQLPVQPENVISPTPGIDPGSQPTPAANPVDQVQNNPNPQPDIPPVAPIDHDGGNSSSPDGNTDGRLSAPAAATAAVATMALVSIGSALIIRRVGVPKP